MEGGSMFKKLKELFTKDSYVIVKKLNGIDYFYQGNTWTPMFEGAKIYSEKPTFSWIDKKKYWIQSFKQV